MYYCSISRNTVDFKTGLTNQIFSLITGILVAIQYNHKVIVVDSFLNDFEKGGYTYLSHVINMDKLRKILKEHYDILIVEKHNATFELLSIHYGTNEKNIDITNEMKQLYVHNNNNLYIDKEINLNNVKGDPCHGVVKNLFITYRVNEYNIMEKYNEKVEDICGRPICFDFANATYDHLFHWSELLNMKPFIDILLSIEYNEEFVKKSQIIYKNIVMDKKINVIHLRIEEDGIFYWARENNMSKDTFRIILTYRYIQLIKKYINKDDETIILSSSTSNGVVDYLTENKYNFRFSEKFYEGREKNAIVDLLISKQCNNLFLGNFNFKNNCGSTFSYYIVKLLNDNVKKVCFDLHQIYDEENIFY